MLKCFESACLATDSLQAAGILRELASYLNSHVPSVELIASSIGLVSAVIDNVPLVAASMGMYDLSDWPMDSKLWQLIAYCAGTGGSILIIGSAAGVAFMGMERADFFWYLKKVNNSISLAEVCTHIGISSNNVKLHASRLAGLPWQAMQQEC